MLAILLLSAIPSACDPIHGISRDATLPFVPDLESVESAIRSVSEVREVRRQDTEGGRTLTLTGLKPPDQLHYFSYDIGATGATLLISVNHRGEVELSQHCLAIGSRVPQEEIDLIRPVMLKIEKALEERCGLTPLVIDEHR